MKEKTNPVMSQLQNHKSSEENRAVVCVRGFAAVRFKMKNFFHFICAFPHLIPKLIKKELALDFLQMFLSKQINLCILNVAFLATSAS